MICRADGGVVPFPSIDSMQDVASRENPLTAGVSGYKVVSMSPWETSRPPGDIRVVFGPDCGALYGREGR